MAKLALTTWQLKQHDDGIIADWIPARVPGSVQQTLLEANLIGDPFYGMNEKDVQWLGGEALVRLEHVAVVGD